MTITESVGSGRTPHAAPNEAIPDEGAVSIDDAAFTIYADGDEFTIRHNDGALEATCHGEYWVIDSIMVQPWARRRRIASRLLDILIGLLRDDATETGMPVEVDLVVGRGIPEKGEMSQRQLQRWYERRGFHLTDYEQKRMSRTLMPGEKNDG
jgi:ribosomal protein S18 acetylase RimI-like enzyme